MAAQIKSNIITLLVPEPSFSFELSLITNLVKATNEAMLLTMDFIPLVSTGKDLLEVVTGEDLLGKELRPSDRALSLVGLSVSLIPFAGNAKVVAKTGVKRFFSWLPKFMGRFKYMYLPL